MRKVKSKVKQYVDKNPIEQILGGGLDGILGITNSKEKQKKQQGELFEGQELNLKELREEELEMQEKNKEIRTDIEYFREIVRVEEKAIGRQSQEIEVQLREIMAEIKKLADSSRKLQMQFREVAVEQHTAKPGKYHKSFFSWLLSLIRTARIKVEDSGAWLAAIHSKKKSRGYWEMAKKGGTTFTLNNERNVATQVG